MVDLGNVRNATAQDNLVDKSKLDAVVRLANGTNVQTHRNAAGDAPSVPALVNDDKKQP
jgi:hypothetical protein